MRRILARILLTDLFHRCGNIAAIPAILIFALIWRAAGLHKKYFIFKIPGEFKRYFNADFIVHISSTGAQEKTLKNWLSSYKPTYYHIKQ